VRGQPLRRARVNTIACDGARRGAGMTASRKRARRSSYRAQVGAVGGSSDSMDLDFDTDMEAVYAAFSTSTPFGHVLGHGRRFIGYFDAGDGRLEALSSRIRAHSAATPSLLRHPHGQRSR